MRQNKKNMQMRQIRMGCQVSPERKGIVMLLLDLARFPNALLKSGGTLSAIRAQESIIQAEKLVPLKILFN